MDQITNADVTLKVKCEIEVPLQTVADTLISAFEGGSNYWYRLEKKVKPKNFAFLSCRELDEKKPFYIDYALNEGGQLVISDYYGVDGDEKEMALKGLDLCSIRDGVQAMATKYPRHFAAMTSDGGDAITGDVLLQCCLFEELVYG